MPTGPGYASACTNQPFTEYVLRMHVPNPQAAVSLYVTFSLLSAPTNLEGGVKGRRKRTLFSGNRRLMAISKTLMSKNRRGPS